MSSAIAHVMARAVRLPLQDPLANSHTRHDELRFVFVRLTDTDGVVGYGETRESVETTGETEASILTAIGDHLTAAVARRDPLDIDGLHSAMDQALPGNNSAKAAVEMAAFDLAGKTSGLPVSNLLGGAPRGPIASSKAVSVGTAEAMAAQAADYARTGFTTLKIKVGIDSETEQTAIAAIRKELGPDISIKLDANQAWTVDEATQFLEAVAPYDIAMIEQPLHADDLAGSAQLRSRVEIPVMLDEGVHTPADALRAIEAGAADYINIKLLKTGGLKPALDIVAISRAAGMFCQIGTLDSTIGSAAAVHLVHACDTIKFAEINGPTRLERDAASGFHVRNGHAVLDEGPGLGVTIEPAVAALFEEKD